MEAIRATPPLSVDSYAEIYRPFDDSELLALTVLVRDRMDRRYSLRIETDAYHTYQAAVTAEEQHGSSGPQEEPEPVFLISPQKRITEQYIRRLLGSEIIIDFLVKQTE